MRYRRSIRRVMAIGLLVSTAAAAQNEEEPQGTLATSSAELIFASAYVWRGLTFTDGAVFQPATTVALDNGLTFNVWGNLDLANSNDLAGDFQEVDLTLAYAIPIESVLSVEVGWIEYLFPNEVGPGTREAFVSLGVDTFLQPYATVYYDFDEVNDFYASFGLQYGGHVSPTLSYSVAAWAGYAGEEFAAAYGGARSGLFDGNLSLTLSYSAGRYDIGGFVAYVDALDDDALADRAVHVYGGINFAISF